jgi:hypothetical protein
MSSLICGILVAKREDLECSHQKEMVSDVTDILITLIITKIYTLSKHYCAP